MHDIMSVCLGGCVTEWDVCVCRYCPSMAGATSVNGTDGCSLYFLGRLYDGVSSRRRGVSSLGLPKPKLHLELNEPVSMTITPPITYSWFWTLCLLQGYLVQVAIDGE